MRARLKKILDSLNFTPTERVVVLILVGAFILGLGIRFFSHGDAVSPRFDYTASDEEFAVKSAARTVSSPVDARKDSLPTPAGVQSPAVPGTSRTLRVDLNRATKRELMDLPGVGGVIAERILLYREDHGAFGSVAELLKVKGIGKKKLEIIAPYCFVEK